MTRHAAEIAGQRVTVQCAEPVGRQAQWLLELLTTQAARGLSLQDGRTIQVGWTILRLRKRGEDLVVCEPDYSGDAFNSERDDVTASLLVQAQQNEVLRRLGEEGEAALFQDKVVFASGSLAERRVYLERIPGSPEGDSGWYVGPADRRDADPHLDAMYVYQLLGSRPALLQVFALPPKYLIVFDGDEIEAVLNQQNVNVWQ